MNEGILQQIQKEKKAHNVRESTAGYRNRSKQWVKINVLVLQQNSALREAKLGMDISQTKSGFTTHHIRQKELIEIRVCQATRTRRLRLRKA